MAEIRVRIAPSPTGEWHLGNARTALFNYLFARRHQGKFYLRVEDTDQTRTIPGAVEELLSLLAWLGMTPDPLPDGRLFLRQSENLARYQAVAETLVEAGKAYYCFATPEELAKLRQEQAAAGQPPRYDGRFRDYPLAEAKERLKGGERHVIRQRLPREGETLFEDAVHGQVQVACATLDDHILLKSDGFPTYHLAHVVDDHDLKISHVIRGDEWLPSAPRHVLLHQDLDWSLPQYAHVPVILGPDKGKLSKRYGARPLAAYRDDGYLPEALINYLTLLGWSSGTEEEIFSRQALIAAFDLARIHPSPAIFDQARLDWFNGQYIRQLAPMEIRNQILNYCRLHQAVWEKRYRADPEKFDAIIGLLHERLVNWREFGDLAAIFYEEPKGYRHELLIAKGSTAVVAIRALTLARETLGQASDWSAGSLELLLRSAVDREGLKSGAVLWPVRVALTGRAASPGVFDLLAILGRETSLRRLETAQGLLKSR